MIIKSASNEIAQLMLDEMNKNSRCPITPDKIAEALDHLTKAAQLFDTIGNEKYSDQVDELIAKLANELRK